MSWIRVCADAPYFEDEEGQTFTPIGQNDAIIWPDLNGLFLGKGTLAVDKHLAYLSAHGVNCMRMMMEYCHTDNRYFEKPAGKFQINMIRFWDNLFLLCEKHKIRVLITPFDTFWMAKRWKFHPYNKLNGGPVASKWKWLKSPEMLLAIKSRFDFFIERWGSSGAIFGWDLWNEVSPVHAGRSVNDILAYIESLSTHIRKKESLLYGKSHLQTISVFAPLLRQHDLAYPVFQHPDLDFATIHLYDAATIDNPKDTWGSARMTGKMVKEAIEATNIGRPFLDSEHGPISYFRRRRQGLPEVFDDEYFLNMQWAHIASGGAGGGMRWPYRHPHVLTNGMRRAQLNLSGFVKLIDWKHFRRENLNDLITVDDRNVIVFGCGDEHQTIIWLLRRNTKAHPGAPSQNAVPKMTLLIPGLKDGTYRIVLWNTTTGPERTLLTDKKNQNLKIDLEMSGFNLALAIVRYRAEGAQNSS